MSADWHVIRLSKLTSKITKGTTPSKKDGGFSESGVNYIKAESVGYDGRIDSSKFAYVTQAVHDKLKRSQLEINDILFSMAGVHLGKVGVVEKKHIPANTNQALALIRPMPELIEPLYLLYFLQQKEVVYFVNNAISQSAQPNINLQQIGNLEIRVPELLIQRKIVGVLSSLNRKIELNRQTGQTLEQIAQAIFKSWFVDFEPVKAKIIIKEKGGNPQTQELAAQAILSGATILEKLQSLDANGQSLQEQLQNLVNQHLAKQNTSITNGPPEKLAATAALFPNALVDSELGEIPEGWRFSQIGDEVTVVGGGTPSTKNAEFWEGGYIHWTTPKDMSNLTDKILIDTERKITKPGLAKISSGLLPVGTVLMSSRAPVGYLAITKIPVAINQGYIAMKCESTLTPEYVVQWAESVMDEIKQRASGTTFAEISKTNFRLISVVVPASDLVSEYSKIIATLYEKITVSLREAKMLTEIRDSLLPKLLSGELDLTG